MRYSNVRAGLLLGLCLVVAPKEALAHPHHDFFSPLSLTDIEQSIQGADPQQASAALHQLLHHPEGKKVLPLLRTTVGSEKVALPIRSEAVTVMALLDQGAESLGVLLKQAGSGDSLMRRRVARAFGILKSRDPRAIKALQSLVSDVDAQVRYRAGEAIWLTDPKLQQHAIAAVAQLIAQPIELDEDEVTHFPKEYRAAALYQQFDEATAKTVLRHKDVRPQLLGALSQALASTNTVVQESALRAFRAAGPDAASVEQIVKLLNGKDENLVVLATLAIAESKGDGVAAQSALLALLANPSPNIRLNAIYSLGEAGVGTEPVVKAMTVSLEDPSLSVQLFAAEALEKLGEAAKPALPKLLEAAKDSKRPIRVRGSMVMALKTLGDPNADALLKELQSSAATQAK